MYLLPQAGNITTLIMADLKLHLDDGQISDTWFDARLA